MHEHDVMLLAVGFKDVIIYPPFAPLVMDPFLGCMDSENIPHVIICDVVFAFYLCIGKNFCQSILVELHISNILQGSGCAAMGCASARVDVDGIVCVLDIC